jgi:hypothetical protein
MLTQGLDTTVWWFITDVSDELAVYIFRTNYSSSLKEAGGSSKIFVKSTTLYSVMSQNRAVIFIANATRT